MVATASLFAVVSLSRRLTCSEPANGAHLLQRRLRMLRIVGALRMRMRVAKPFHVTFAVLRARVLECHAYCSKKQQCCPSCQRVRICAANVAGPRKSPEALRAALCWRHRPNCCGG